MKRNYLKLLALDINALEVRVLEDKNVKNFQAINDYLLGRSIENECAMWIILPCSYELK